MKAIERLEKEIRQGSLSHAYLFVGNDEGVIARAINLLIESQGILSEDTLELRPGIEEGKAGEIKIEEVRNLVREINLSPLGPARLAVVYGAERLNISSGNILLKTIEEPPGKAIIILISATDLILPTIRSRCRVFHFSSTAAVESNYSIQFIKTNFLTISREIEKIIKSNEIDLLFDGLEQSLRRELVAKRNPKAAIGLRSLFEAKKSLAANINARLVLENLILTVRDIG